MSQGTIRSHKLPETLAAFRQVGTSPLELWHCAGVLTAGTTTTFATTVDQYVAVPYVEQRGGTLDRLQFEVTTLVAGGLGRAGIYANAVRGFHYPGRLIVDGGQQDCSSTGLKAATITTALVPGTLYWFVLVTNSSTIAVRGQSPTSNWPTIGINNSTSPTVYYCLTLASSYAALSTSFGASALRSSTPTPLICVRYSA